MNTIQYSHIQLNSKYFFFNNESIVLIRIEMYSKQKQKQAGKKAKKNFS